MEYQRQGSISHAGGADELDFADLTEQINEYEKALEERLSDYREGKITDHGVGSIHKNVE